MSKEVSLREYLEAELRHQRELRAEDQKQLALQAKEIERRLQDLNGETGRIHTVLAATVPREVFEVHKDMVIKALQEGVGRSKGFSIAWNIAATIIGMIIGAAGVLAVVK